MIFIVNTTFFKLCKRVKRLSGSKHLSAELSRCHLALRSNLVFTFHFSHLSNVRVQNDTTKQSHITKPVGCRCCVVMFCTKKRRNSCMFKNRNGSKRKMKKLNTSIAVTMSTLFKLIKGNTFRGGKAGETNKRQVSSHWHFPTCVSVRPAVTS